MKLENMSGAGKAMVDALSFGTLLGALVNYLPSIAAAFTIIWTAIRIYETHTVQRIFGRGRDE